MVAVILCGCVCCGLLCGFPRPVKLVALVCFIPMALFFLFYFAWLAVGTYLLTQINGAQYGNDVICRNILVFMIALWFYFFCLFVVAILIIVWKLCSLKKSKGRRKKDDQLLAGIV